MTDEIERLVIAVDSTSATRATDVLNTLARSANNARAVLEVLAKALGPLSTETAKLNALVDRQVDAYAKLASIHRSAAFSAAAPSAGTASSSASVDGTADAAEKLSANAGEARKEIASLILELAQGDFAGAQKSLLSVADATGLLAALMTPAGAGVGSLAAGLGLVASAAADVYREQQKMAEAIAVSGNYAGVTSGSIDTLASGMGSAAGRIADARDIIDSLVASGKVGATSLESVGQAAYDLTALTKMSASDAAQTVLAMFDGTVAGLVKANEQYHFLTEATYEQVKALEDEGRQQDAVRVAAEAFHDAMAPRLQTMTEDVYGLAKAWGEASKGVSQWYETFKNGASIIVGTASLDNQIAALEGKKQAAENHEYSLVGQARNLFFSSYLVDQSDSSFVHFSPTEQSELDGLQAKKTAIVQKADQDAQLAADRAAVIGADQYIDRLTEQVERTGVLTASTKELKAAFDTIWGKSSVLDNKRLVGVERVVNEDDSVSFYGGLYDTLQRSIGKRNASAPGAPATRTQARAAPAMPASVAAPSSTSATQAVNAEKKRVEAIDAYTEALRRQDAAAQSDADLQILRLSLGDKEFANLQRIVAIQRQGADEIAALRLKRDSGQLDQKSYDVEAAARQESTDRRLRIEKETQQRTADAKGDWATGASKALDELQEKAGDAAGAFYTTIGAMNTGLADLLTSAALTGKASIKDFVSSILKEIARIETNRFASQLLSMGLDSLLGSAPILSSADQSAGLLGSVNDDIAGYRKDVLAGGARANGGSTDPESSYRVAEQGPELYSTVGGDNFLLTGKDAGTVTPLERRDAVSGQGGGTQVSVVVNIASNGAASGDVNAHDADALGRDLGQQMQVVAEQVVARNLQPGGKLWRASRG